MGYRSIIYYLVFMVLLAATSFADIYKCVSEDGVATFSDEPCAKKAQIAFKTENLNFDDAIGNASPYDDQPVEASKIYSEDFVAHAKKIGRYILPFEYNNTCINRSSPTVPGWRISLFFGPESNKKEFEVDLVYNRNPTSNGTYVWLNSISVKKNGKPFNPSSMANVKTYKRMGSGRWEAILK
ncbi:MAG: DUF4124 domain-containing protein [Proteobacteria bacterium]|nr:DUF4124 domain-containing protein [Pseudomonadota bacterium]MBU1582945.1 DUF4124 domain-containing protein [Pseudomonadota bacterium]MBU2451756.1 DUF4124 domain-containing protein [Pseudomonadota bacterium]MBU2629428.1 DUF4124 domain-containing protein [Pseudomonadota bacterium]